MLTLSYGVKKPETGDKGSVFFPALESNAQIQNDHSHNGSDSAKLTTAATVASTTSISDASWADQGGGLYRQEITVPAGVNLGECAMIFKETTNNEAVQIRHEQLTTTTYYVFTNDATLALTAFYLS